MTTPLLDQLVHKINRLPARLQRKVLIFVDALQAAEITGGSGAALLKFAGQIPLNDLRLMGEAIEEGCERVETSEW
jgi:hypothetical protein